MMPKGVEHRRKRGAKQWGEFGVKIPMMPKGVEHFDRDLINRFIIS